MVIGATQRLRSVPSNSRIVLHANITPKRPIKDEVNLYTFGRACFGVFVLHPIVFLGKTAIGTFGFYFAVKKAMSKPVIVLAKRKEVDSLRVKAKDFELPQFRAVREGIGSKVRGLAVNDNRSYDEDYKIYRDLRHVERELLWFNHETGARVEGFRTAVIKHSDAEGKKRLDREAAILSELGEDERFSMSQFQRAGIMPKGSPFAGDSYLSLKRIEGVTLKELISNGNLTSKERSYLSLELANLVHILHKKGFVHKDLKPENIMVGLDGKLRLIDFGLSGRINDPSPEGVSGTSKYISPEAINENDKGEIILSTSMDVWALGLIILDIYNPAQIDDGHFLLTDQEKLVGLFVQRTMESSDFEGNSTLASIISETIIVDTEKRATVSQLVDNLRLIAERKILQNERAARSERSRDSRPVANTA